MLVRRPPARVNAPTARVYMPYSRSRRAFPPILTTRVVRAAFSRSRVFQVGVFQAKGAQPQPQVARQSSTGDLITPDGATWGGGDDV